MASSSCAAIMLDATARMMNGTGGSSMSQHPWLGRSLVLCLAVLTLSAGRDAVARGKPKNPSQAVGSGEPSIAQRYDDLVTKARDLEYADLLRQLAIGPPAARKLSFEPTQARYFAEVDRALELTKTEQATFERNGFAMVDHGGQLSMGQAYLEIYRADLPVFVTTDSVLHALHRSYDSILMELEQGMLFNGIDAVLARLQSEVCKLPRSASLSTNVEDLNLYVAVARKLLAAGRTTGNRVTPAAPSPEPCGDDAALRMVLGKISALVDDPMVAGTPLFGQRRPIVWSQFRPRGHYVKTPRLEAYFRAMMWLGRADLAWNPAVPRELRDAALLTLLATKSGQQGRLAQMSRVIDFLVGRADSLGPVGMGAALTAAGITSPEGIDQPDALARLQGELGKLPEAAQQIRSQVVASDPDSPQETPLPAAFQLFGQRFVLDSFLLSKVVFDSILFHGHKQQRSMPSGLDVMAALGSDEAVRLLEPELVRFHYAANLLAARQLFDGFVFGDWERNVYVRWLHALRLLQRPPASANLPQAMRTPAWQRKELQTGLASWAELRHDTILYAKQSMTAGIICEYPEGYVEPYPDFFATLAGLARQAGSFLADPALAPANPQRAAPLTPSQFFERFAKTMDRLEAIARKELAARPLDADEKKFLKDVIDQKVHYGCGGPPTYSFTGWYPQLIYGHDPLKREPTVADVHTVPGGGVLEEGVGDARYMVIAVDNRGDHAVYVGPTSSYYEFTSRTRLNDAEWTTRIGSTAAPAFTGAFVSPPVKRDMVRPKKIGGER
jgi:hypothetical protein